MGCTNSHVHPLYYCGVIFPLFAFCKNCYTPFLQPIKDDGIALLRQQGGYWCFLHGRFEVR